MNTKLDGSIPNQLHSYDNESESDDDWFYDSIKRYKLLQMFDFQTAKSHIFLSDVESICVAGKCNNGQNEIMELQLPKKLTTCGQGKLEKSSDLSVSCGGYTENPLIDIKAMYGRKMIITSEKDVFGVKLYQLGSEDSDQIMKCNNFQIDISEPSLAINKTDKLVAATNTDSNLYLIDTVTGKQITSVMLTNENCGSRSIKGEFVNNDLLAICELESGATNIYDFRSNSICYNLLSDQKKENDEWTLSSKYSCNPSVTDEASALLGLISKDGNLKIFDLRQPKDSIHETNIFLSLELKRRRINSTNIFLRFSPVKSNVVSISGFDENVYVCEIISDKVLKLIFKHDGHKNHTFGRNLYTTDHIWYGGCIISASENKTVQCWQYAQER